MGEPETQTHSRGVPVSTFLHTLSLYICVPTESSHTTTLLSCVTVSPSLSCLCHQGGDTPAEGLFCQQEDEHWGEGKVEAATGNVDKFICSA